MRRFCIMFMLVLCGVLSLGAGKAWKSKRITLTVTGYCPFSCCCDGFADGKTATGRDATKPGVAVDPKVIPLGSRLDIPFYGKKRGWWTPADDVGGKIKGNKIDVRFKTHAEAKKWGVKTLKVRVWTRR